MPNYKTMMDLPYLGAYSLENIKEHELTLTIKAVKGEEITGEGGLKNKKPVLYFHENAKPMVLNSTNAKTLTTLAGSSDTDAWVGLRITVFASKTKFGRDMVDCLRIRPFLAKPATASTKQPDPIKCADCGKTVTAYTAPSGKTFTAENIAENAMKKYSRVRCMECITADAQLRPSEPSPDQTEGDHYDPTQDYTKEDSAE